MDFKAYQKNRANLLEEIQKKTENSNKIADDRFWKLPVSQAGTGSAIIRFLPGKNGVPFTHSFSHGFKEKGWLIENCPTTIGQECPICESNSVLWDTGDEDTARKRKRKRRYFSNILVIKDNDNPDNNGKVFLFQYGVKIHEKLMALIKPSDENIQEPENPTDFFVGRNFVLIQKKKDGYPNYDDSSFKDISSVKDELIKLGMYKTDKDLEKVFDSQFDLDEFTSASNFKTYEELKTALNRALGIGTKQSDTTSSTVEEKVNENDDDLPFYDSSGSETTDDEDIQSIMEKIEENG